MEIGNLLNPSGKEKRELTREAFDLLLARLDPDRDLAGEKYETVRRKLVKFLGWWGSDFPEDHADETINRVTRKLLAEEEILDINKYCAGVARLVYLEHVKERVRSSEALAGLARSSTNDEHPGHREARFQCYEQCLQTIAEANRDLVMEYYQVSGTDKAYLRQKLAERMGIPLNLLRIRAFRIRNTLKDCVRVCLRRWSDEV